MEKRQVCTSSQLTLLDVPSDLSPPGVTRLQRAWPSCTLLMSPYTALTISCLGGGGCNPSHSLLFLLCPSSNSQEGCIQGLVHRQTPAVPGDQGTQGYLPWGLEGVHGHHGQAGEAGLLCPKAIRWSIERGQKGVSAGRGSDLPGPSSPELH